jgi:hypothetical protein
VYPAVEKRYAAVLQYIVEKRDEGERNSQVIRMNKTTELISFIYKHNSRAGLEQTMYRRNLPWMCSFVPAVNKKKVNWPFFFPSVSV